jgi:hypothetical protein
LTNIQYHGNISCERNLQDWSSNKICSGDKERMLDGFNHVTRTLHSFMLLHLKGKRETPLKS